MDICPENTSQELLERKISKVDHAKISIIKSHALQHKLFITNIRKETFHHQHIMARYYLALPFCEESYIGLRQETGIGVQEVWSDMSNFLFTEHSLGMYRNICCVNCNAPKPKSIIDLWVILHKD